MQFGVRRLDAALHRRNRGIVTQLNLECRSSPDTVGRSAPRRRPQSGVQPPHSRAPHKPSSRVWNSGRCRGREATGTPRFCGLFRPGAGFAVRPFRGWCHGNTAYGCAWVPTTCLNAQSRSVPGAVGDDESAVPGAENHCDDAGRRESHRGADNPLRGSPHPHRGRRNRAPPPESRHPQDRHRGQLYCSDCGCSSAAGGAIYGLMFGGIGAGLGVGVDAAFTRRQVLYVATKP